MKKPTYPVVIEYSPEDRGYVARVPALKYCTAFGGTYEEAASELQTAIEGWTSTNLSDPSERMEMGLRCFQAPADFHHGLRLVHCSKGQMGSAAVANG